MNNRKVYNIIISKQTASPHAMEEVIEDTNPENPQDYLNIIYWCKHMYLDKKNRWQEFSKLCQASRCKCKCKNNKNVVFWHFQHTDGTVLDPDNVKDQGDPAQIKEDLPGKGCARGLD